jgi:O-antigen/teichoic acid export membrane protein
MVEALAAWSLTPVLMTAGGIAFSALLIGLGWYGIPGSNRFARNAVQRLAKNSVAPIAGQFANRAVDLVFAAFTLRLLGVTGNGEYAIAIVTWLYVKTISDFGLNVLVTREVAREPDQAGRLLGASTLLRLIILGILIVPVGLYAVGGQRYLNLSTSSTAAIALLTLSIIPSSYTDAINSIFNGRERMELPALLNVLTNLARAGFGLAALFAGYGVVGLAVVALLSTTISTAAYRVAMRHLAIWPVWSLSRTDARQLTSLAWPLLLNGLLLNLFFRADVFVIQASQGNHALGIYDAAYKFLNTVQLVPAYFTLAAFPILSRYAASDHSRLVDSYRLAAKFMLVIAWPMAIGTVALAPFLIGILGGSAFLPDSAVTLRVLIWYLPLSYVNGITQYVLIAANHQRSIMTAFGFAVAFNFGMNLLFVPMFGYIAAAVITVATEVVLFLVLSRSVKRWIGPIGWLPLMGRPLGAACTMVVALVTSLPLGGVLALGIAGLAYLGGLIVLRVIGHREVSIARALLGRTDPITS